METDNRTEIEKRIDIIEDDIAKIDPLILNILLQDKTTKENIMWCTRDYESYGPEYHEKEQIRTSLITGYRNNVIQPRAAKSKEVQERRIKKRAEVFTPSWVVNEQNNQIDNQWFGKSNVFNTPTDSGWITNKEKIVFGDESKSWTDYVSLKRLEITCGEAPYLVSRYDTTTGELIPLYERVGLFDRKMRIVNENCDDLLWDKWSIRALQSVYGYEFQGDSVLIARENLLYDYIDYFRDRFEKEPSIEILKKVANIISWNIWQMDGFSCVVPYSCHKEQTSYQMSIFDIGQEMEKQYVDCPGCENNNLFKHNGTYCRIFDWTDKNKSIPFIDMFKEGAQYGKV